MSEPKEIAKTINGKQYKYYEFGKGDVTVVFLHGLAGSPQVHFWLAENLSKNFKCLLPVLPGHFGIPLEYISNMDDFVEYINGFIKELVKGDYFIAGFSLGGLISLKFADKYSTDRSLKGAVAWASPILGMSQYSNIVVGLEQKMSKRSYDFISKIFLQKIALKVFEGEFRALVIDAYCKLPYKTASIISKMMREADFLPSLRSPVRKLLIFGNPDRLISRDNLDLCNKHVCENYKLVVVKNGGHGSNEIGLRKAGEEIEEFLISND